jgi:ATP-binding cassette, subfamily C (CFTR/MRP), member 1
MVAIVALQLALVVLWSQGSSYRTTMSIPAAVLSLLVTVTLVPLVWLEHHRCIQPSALICSYLFLVSILDLAQLRTLWLVGSYRETLIASVFSAAFALRIVALGNECFNKTRYFVKNDDFARSPEEKCGIVSRSLFLWLNPLIYLGYRRTIVDSDLYPLPAGLDPQSLDVKLQEAWAKRTDAFKSSNM